MKHIYIIFVYSFVFSQSLQTDAILKNTYFSAISSLHGHAHSTLKNSPMNAYFNPAGLAVIESQRFQVDASLYLNTKEYPDSETLYPVSINSIAFAAPISSNLNSPVIALTLRAPLMNSYEYKILTGLADSYYQESYQIYQYGFSYAQKLSKQINVGINYSVLSGTTKIEEKSTDSFSRKRKDEIQIIESPKSISLAFQYLVKQDLEFAFSIQGSTSSKLKDSRENNEKGYTVHNPTITKFGSKLKLSQYAELLIDYHSISQKNEKTLHSLNTGFNLDIFEDLGFGLGLIFFDPIDTNKLVYTLGLSYTSDYYRLIAAMDYSQKNRRDYYFNNSSSSQILLQATLEFFY